MTQSKFFWGNESLIDTLEKELPESTLYWLFISIAVAVIWIIYLTLFNARVLGLILTAILNKFVRYGHIKFGSFSFSVLSGKVMFRDVHLITEDFSVRAQLGMVIFRWWRPLTHKEITEDLSHSNTRLSLYLETFEIHVYNRTSVYARLEQLFGLDRLMEPNEPTSPTASSAREEINRRGQNAEGKWQWRDLIPVIKVEISSGKLVFGNYNIPTTLSVNIGEAHVMYTTKPASTPFDLFMHIIKCRAERLKVMFVNSPKYTGPVDEPPRFMGDGFVVLQSNEVDIYYYHDEPGLVPYEPELVQLANGDVVARRTWPCWGMDVKCGKGTDLSYGPWADRQREYLYKWFYPPDFQAQEVILLPEPGTPRMFRNFDFKLSMQKDCTFDILFTKNKETQAVHMNMTQGTYLEFTVPMIVEDSGYEIKINGQLFHLDATTSLPFRSLLECESFEFNVDIHYPINWNDHQDWKCDFTACKVTLYFIYHHKVFFTDLIEDWSSRTCPDIFHFVPYTWSFSFLLKEFELLTIANEWNWIDCFGTTPENALVGFCGEIFDLSFALPFIDYLPATVPIKFFVRGENADARLYLPETNTSRHVIIALSESNRITGRDGVVLDGPFSGYPADKKWHRVAQKSNGWVDIMTTPIVAISITYMYHPIPPSGEDPLRIIEEPISTPEAEEQLLIPLRLVPLRPLRPRKTKMMIGPEEFDPTRLDADQITVELEVGPSVLMVYGSLLKIFMTVKENYFGVDQKFTDYEEVSHEKSSTFTHVSALDGKDRVFDPRHYRPLHIKLNVTLHDIQAHLVKHCSDDSSPCPSVFLERLAFEMDKVYLETKLQVLVSPAILIVKDTQERPECHNHLNDGHLCLSGLQVRGHAMFSHDGLPLDSETLEYAWLIEVTIGDITGKITAPQLKSIIEFAQTAFFLVDDAENDLQRPSPIKLCQHMIPQNECQQADAQTGIVPCPGEEDLKYRLTRVSIDCVDLYLVESGAALNLQVYPVRVSTCNLHGKSTKAGVTVVIPQFSVKQFVLSTPPSHDYSSVVDQWLEAGGVGLGPVNVDAAMAIPDAKYHAEQDRFLKHHDRRTRRLWFLWPPDLANKAAMKVIGKCGCMGGCTFFGNNRNGPRFFLPAEMDYNEGYGSAVYHICSEPGQFGYGQSLLQKAALVFDVESSTLPPTPSKSKMLAKLRGARGSKRSMDTMNTSTTLDDSTLRPGSLLSYISDHSSIARRTDTSGSEHTLKGSAVNMVVDGVERSSVKSGRSAGVNGQPDFIPDVTGPDAYESDKVVSTPSDTTMTWTSGGSGSVASLPEVLNKKEFGHERKHSYDTKTASFTGRKRSLSTITDEPSSPTSLILGRRDSRGSQATAASSGAFSASRQSSLTSPILRRLSSQVLDGSTSSMMGSDAFLSATESLSEASGPSFHSSKDKPHTPVSPLARKRSECSDQTPLFGQSFSDGQQTVIHHSAVDHDETDNLLSSSEHSDSESATSFVSAVSSQQPSVYDWGTPKTRSLSNILDNRDTSSRDDGPEYVQLSEDEDDDFTVPDSNLVDLHGQINQPITRSPLLMSCYINHMTQLQCSHWSSPPPLLHLVSKSEQLHADQSVSSIHTKLSPSVISDHGPSTAWIPHFAYRHEGFGPTMMANKREPRTPPSLSSPSSASDWDKSGKVFSGSLDLSDGDEGSAEPVSKTTAIVNLKGAVDLLISPLMLETLQRYIEAVTPVLAELHPSSIVDGLHFQCSNTVKAQNRLKKRASREEVAERKDEKETPEPWKSTESPQSTVNVSRQSKTSRVQVMFSLSKINICILQASLVEETIPFAALDHIRELTCVSTLTACLDNITCQLLLNNHSEKVMEHSIDSSPDSGAKKSFPLEKSSGKNKGDLGLPSPDLGYLIDSESEQLAVETQKEEMVGNLHISRIHFQLRRMKRNSNYSDNVFLTAIPERRSKVLFTFQKTMVTEPVVPSAPGTTATIHEHPAESNTAEDLAGFIMFECGLEDINLRAAKRSGFSGSASEDETKLQIDRLLSHISAQPPRIHKRTSRVESKESVSRTVAASDEDISGLGNSADDEASSWQSRLSVKTNDSQDPGEDESEKDLDGDASSCELQFKGVWFNFAAPPPSPKKRKLEYTRLDWNLLSTATPAINSWMKPAHRAIMASKILVAHFKQRVSTVMACIMTEALDVPSIHVPVRKKYNKITSLSKTLQEDPSCQLLTVLRLYIKKVGIESIEQNINVDTIPQLITIQKGLLALTRQWKNVLYMPVETTFKSKKKVQPYTVTFAIPKDDSVENFQGLDDGDMTLDNFDVVDEKTSLLKAEGGGLYGHRVGSLGSLTMSLQPPPSQLSQPAAAAATAATDNKPQVLISKEPSIESEQHPNVDKRSHARSLRRNESAGSFQTAASLSASSQDVGVSMPSTPLKASLTRQLSELEKREDEDLYRWMQRQQEYTRLCDHPSLHYYPSVGHDSFITTGLSEHSQDDSISMQKLALGHSFLQLADAQVLFRPLLRSMGIYIGAVKTSAFMKKFGSNVSIQGSLQTLRVDIVDSEQSSSKKKNAKGKQHKGRKFPKFSIDMGMETPAFICEGFSVMICMKDIVDFEKDAVGGVGGGEWGGSHVGTGVGGADWRRRSVKAIKFAMEHMEAKPSTTKVHFSLNLNNISQHVNMSLLRLAHQFASMIENIIETKVELAEHKPSPYIYKTHRKQDSKGSSTGTESQATEFDSTKADVTSPLSPDIDTPTPDSSTPFVKKSASDTKAVLQGSPRPESKLRVKIPRSPSDQQRPDKLPLASAQPPSKSPKKFSFRKSKIEFFGKSTDTSNTVTTTTTTSGSDSKTSVATAPAAVQSPPHSLNLSDSVVVEMADTSSPAIAEKTIVDEIKESTPRCWRTLYSLLELYSTMPETKTLGRRISASRLSVIDEEPEKMSQAQSLPRFDSATRMRQEEDVERQSDNGKPVEKVTSAISAASVGAAAPAGPAESRHRSYTGSTFTQSIFIGERIPLVVFGMAKVRHVRISAMLSGLKLEATLQNVNASATHRERVKGVIKRKSHESSATAHVGHAMIVLLEGEPPNMQTVVTVNVGKSQGLYSSVNRKTKDHNSALVTIGRIDVDIPQHPVVLHGMVARSSRRLSSTLQEFIRPPAKSRSYDSVDNMLPTQQPSRHSDLGEPHETQPMLAKPAAAEAPPELKPLVIHFKATLSGLVIGASLLPSLKAQYKMGEVNSSGITGQKARFTINLPTHSLSFSSKVSISDVLPPRSPRPVTPSLRHLLRRKPPSPPTPPLPRAPPTPPPCDDEDDSAFVADDSVSTPSTLPSSASVDLPPIHIHADYRPHSADTLAADEGLTEGLVLREGHYLNAVAEVGAFEHSLTTDLLNHLVFVQKVFMKEVNEVVQKVSGADQPVPIWTDDGISVVPKDSSKPMLYSFIFRLKGIQITATTPTMNAVRLETGSIELELSNRVQTASTDSSTNKHTTPKLFVKMQVDLNLALGMLMCNPMFEEAEPEFQHLASFATRIGLRNALQDEMIPGVSKDQEALLISLKRPIVFVQPSAFDKAVLVWLNYKNAYEYWNEQRLALNKEVQTATQQVIDKLPLGNISQQAAPIIGTLFLQLTVDDLGICLPMTDISQAVKGATKHIDDPGAALVLTLESTQISACSHGSLVSKGKFTGFCLRFADDFEVSWDDWKPDRNVDVVMNAMVVPEGTYEVCSRTINAIPNTPNSSAKWILNVLWLMTGVDINLDTNIGKRLSTLSNTLTMLTGEVEADDVADEAPDDELEDTEGELPTIKGKSPRYFKTPTTPHKVEAPRKLTNLPEGLPDFVYDSSLDAKTRARLIENEMNEQAKVVQDLKQLGASLNLREAEERKLQELQSAVFQDFRQDILNRLKRQSVKATALKDKLGLGYKPASHVRSKSSSAVPHLVNKRNSRADARRLASHREEGRTPLSHARTQSFDLTEKEPPKIRLQKHDFLSTTVDDPSFFEDAASSARISEAAPHETFPPPRPQFALPEAPDTSTSDEGVEDPELNFLNRNYRRMDESRQPSPTFNVKNTSMQQVEPNVDFELDIKVTVSSGQCVLHPKESRTLLDYDDPKRLIKKDARDISPLLSRKHRKKMSADSSSRARYAQLGQPQQSLTDNTTVFFLPGVDVKVRYDSKFGPSGAESPTSSRDVDNVSSADASPAPPLLATSTPAVLETPSAFTFQSTAKKAPSVKRASMYAWISLQQLSEEMLISPVLLDFLEQALEPIPMSLTQDKSQTKTSTLSSDSTDLDASTASLASGSYAYVSIPVDVVVYIKVKPSLIRFSCVPVSRVECLLRLPSLDLVFSTKRADVEATALPDSGTPTAKAKGSRKLAYSSQVRSSSNLRQRTTSGGLAAQLESGVSGGLSVTGCLADFSLYVFHPYGGGQKKTSLVALEKFESSYRRTPGKSTPAADDSVNSPAADMARKDSLSLNVEFVKVDVSRSRKGVVSGEAVFNPTMSSSKLSSLLEASPKAANHIRFSAICDIGSASFKYDMRRLTEILALPKAWYRRSLARRLFLGEEMTGDILTDEDSDSCSSMPSPDSRFFGPFSAEGRGRAQTTSDLHTSHMDPALSAVQSQHRRVNSESKNIPLNLDFKKELDDLNPSRTPSGSGSSPHSPSDEQQQPPPVIGMPRPLGPAARPKQTPVSSLAREPLKTYEHLTRGGSQFTTPIAPGKKIKEWETLVLFAVNLSRLDVMVNMSNVMGNTVWSTKDLKSQGRLSIDSSGSKDVKISAGLTGSKLEARGGIVGGYIQLHQLHSYFKVNEDPEHEPDHKAGVTLYTLESRLDYMGSSVLMGRISDVGMELSDEWKLDTRKRHSAVKGATTEVLVHMDMGWDKLHLMISRSTTPDIIKMVTKVEEFLSQQLHSSKRVFISMGPLTTSKAVSVKSKSSTDDASWIDEIRHHRHWQKVLELVSGCKLSMFNFTLPESGTSLGGSVSLHGNNLSLACFHGINFRSKSWALFTMAEPNILFATGAQGSATFENLKCTDIQENLTFQLGHTKTEKVREKHMATILKVSRGHYMPPPFTSVQEWFHYAFSTTEIKDLDSFPQVMRQDSESPTERRSASRKSQEYSHETEIVFALPSLQMNLQTKHVQSEHPPREDEKKPVVECSFHTEFDDHIFVAMDAELVLFLHDLVTSYVKEKDKGTRTSTLGSRARSPESEKKLMSDPTSVLKQDYREFNCVYWKLEPTVRLISWAGKRIDPVGVDYILQKLGFQHARLTIPKWMQRGAMDPLDKVLSMLTHRIIQVLKEPDKEPEEASK